MARVHYWSFLQDTTGAPIEGADVYIYLAGTQIAASIYTHEISDTAIFAAPQLKTNSLGFFEFWVADKSESDLSGYDNDQKFKIVYERDGVGSGMIDYIDIFISILPVDPDSDDTTINKAISNSMAKKWNSIADYTGHEIFGIEEADLSTSSSERNKLVSNDLINLWQNHRKEGFIDGVVATDYSDEALMPWEDAENYPDIYGPHGILKVDIDSEDKANTSKNRLVSNYMANKWEAHTTYSFEDEDISFPDFSLETAHGLYRVDISEPNFDLNDPYADVSLVKEYNQYNKLVSNRLIREINSNIDTKMSMSVTRVEEFDWETSAYETDINVVKIQHNLNTRFVGVDCVRKIERINYETGNTEYLDNIFSPEDIFVISENELEIHSSLTDACYIIVWGRKNFEYASAVDSISTEDI